VALQRSVLVARRTAAGQSVRRCPKRRHGRCLMGVAGARTLACEVYRLATARLLPLHPLRMQLHRALALHEDMASSRQSVVRARRSFRPFAAPAGCAGLSGSPGGVSVAMGRQKRGDRQ
jgi:hypothetical protein